MKKAERLLQLVTERLPPEKGRRHALHLEDGRLKIGLTIGDKWQTLNFDEGTSRRPPKTLPTRSWGSFRPCLERRTAR